MFVEVVEHCDYFNNLTFSFTLDEQISNFIYQKRENLLQNILKYMFMTFVFITLQLQFFFVLQNKIIKWADLRKKERETDNLFENGSNRLVGHRSGEGQWVMVSLLSPPTHKGGAFSWLPGNRVQRTSSSSVGPVGKESGSANCCHLGTRTHRQCCQLRQFS